MRFGADGYAIYWYCLELIAGDLEAENANFELSHDAEVIGFNLKVDQIRVEEIMRYMVDLKLFEQSDSTITCLKIAKFLDKKTTRNKDIHKIIDKFNDIESVADKTVIVADKTVIVADKTKHSALEEKRREEKEHKNITPLKMLMAMGVSEQLSKDWLTVRKLKKQAPTQTAFDRIKKHSVENGFTFEKAIEICTENGWAGFNVSWLDSKSQSNNFEGAI